MATRPPARPIRRLITAAASAGALAAVLFWAGTGPAATQSDPADWPAYLHDAGHSSFNAAATAIAPGNVSLLVPVWKWATPASPNAGPNTILASPTVVNGVVYAGAEDGYFYAISEATRNVLWSDFLGLDAPRSTTSCVKHVKGITGTATVADDPNTGNPTVYVNAPDGKLYALDAQTGAVVWAGVVDTPSTTKNDYYAWGSPLVANGKVYVGISSDSDCPLVPGGVVSFDQATGAQVAKWIDVPTGSSKGLGGSVWSSPALLANGDIAVTTGNGYSGSGQPLYNESIVRLDPTSLAVLDYWQVPHTQQVDDGDFGASPTVWTATINGASTPMVGACNKDGIFYAFAQGDLTAGPIWQTRITVPYPGGDQECNSAAVFDNNQLIVGGGAPTTINGTSYPGSVQSLDPATGVPNWQVGLQGQIVGTPTEDGGGVVAAPVFTSANKSLGVYLLNAANGASLGFINTGMPMFGQAVFAQNNLIIGAGGSYGVQAFAVASPGPPITKVLPNIIGPGTTTTVKLTGSGFSGSPTVLVSGGQVTVQSVTVVSSTLVKAVMVTKKTATLGTYDVTVVEPGPVADSCTSCLTIGTPPPRPVPTSINPSSYAPGSANTAAVIQGSNFESGATVTSHRGISISKVNFVNAGQLNVSVTVASTVTPGNYNIFVNNPDGYSGECQGCLTVS